MTTRDRSRATDRRLHGAPDREYGARPGRRHGNNRARRIAKLNRQARSDPREVRAGIEIVRAVRRLDAFLRLGWEVITPDAPLVWNLALEAMCQHLQAVADGRIKRLIISVPPGFAKSTLVSVYFPAWMWLTRPAHKFLAATHGLKLTLQHSVAMRQLVTSEWYRTTFDRWVGGWSMSPDEAAKGLFSNTRRGRRNSVSVGSGVTGHRGNTILIDDPIDATKAHNVGVRTAAHEWFGRGAWNRLYDMDRDAIILISQRLHRDDMAGYLIEQGIGNWTHLVLPNEYEPDHPNAGPTSIGWCDPRTEPGQLLCPRRFSAAATADAQKRHGVYAAQYQQRPRDTEGKVWRQSWFRYWTPREPTAEEEALGSYRRVPVAFDEVVISADMTFGSKRKKASHTTFQAWGRKGANIYLLDELRGKWIYPDARHNFLTFCARWPQAMRKIIEYKAAGTSLIQELQNEVAGLIPVSPVDDKETRASVESVVIESGNVYVPAPRHRAWSLDYLDEVCAFPDGGQDDRVDTTSQVLKYFREASGGDHLMMGVA